MPPRTALRGDDLWACLSLDHRCGNYHHRVARNLWSWCYRYPRAASGDPAPSQCPPHDDPTTTGPCSRKRSEQRAWTGGILTVRRRAPVDRFSTHVGIEHTRRDIADRSVEVIPRCAIDPRRSAQRYVATPGTQKSFVIVRIVHKCSSKLAEVIAAQRHASRLAGVPQGRRTETECGGPD